MTPPQLLRQAQPGNFVGRYKAPIDEGGSKVPVLDIYEGEIPAAAKAALDGSNVNLYEFMPIPGDEGDIISTKPEPYAAAAIGDVTEEDGRVGANLTLVVRNPDAPSSAGLPNPVIEGRSRFARIIELLTRKESVDYVDMRRENTNLGPEEARMLGFNALEGDPDVLRLDLPNNHRPAAAA